MLTHYGKGDLQIFKESISWQQPIIDKDLTAPPGSPVSGDRYLIPAGATGAWSGQTNKIAEYSSGEWIFLNPTEPFFVWALDENEIYYWNGSSWVKYSPVGVADQDLQYVDSITTTTTTSASYVDLATMTLTTSNTSSRAYQVSFIGDFSNSADDEEHDLIINVNGTDITNTFKRIVVYHFEETYQMANQLKTASIGSGIVIKVRWRTSGGTASCFRRSLMIQGIK